MSRIGKQPIIIPDGVEVKVDKKLITVKGPKGELTQKTHSKVKIEFKDQAVIVTVKNENDKKQRALWGLYGSLISNMVLGVTEGYSKELNISGVGFKATVAGSKLTLNVGYSHPVEFDIPEGIEVKVDGETITVVGIDKQLVGEVAAQIRKIKPVEPYKLKGIKYSDEHISKKVGKAAAGEGAAE